MDESESYTLESESYVLEVVAIATELMTKLATMPAITSHALSVVFEDLALVMKACGQEEAWRKNTFAVWAWQLYQGNLAGMVQNDCPQHRAFVIGMVKPVVAQFDNAPDAMKDVFGALATYMATDECKLSDAEAKVPADARARRVKMEAKTDEWPKRRVFLEANGLAKKVTTFVPIHKAARERLDKFLATTTHVWDNRLVRLSDIILPSKT
jgi:hypothetical protein